MSLESATYISQLIATNPVGAVDYVSQGDDHLRLVKTVLLNSFPNISGAVTATHTELNRCDGLTSAIIEANDVDNTPVSGATTVPISSGYIYNLINAATAFNRIDLDGELREKVYNLTGNTIDPANGTIQSKTLTGAWSPTVSFGDGESVYLRIVNTPGYTITWPSIKWSNKDTAPSLQSDSAVVLWKEGANYYGHFAGDFAP